MRISGSIFKSKIWLGLGLFSLAVLSQADPISQVKVVLFPFRHAVISARVDSFVKQYQVREGEEFKKDSLVVTLEEDNYLQEFLRAQAAWEEKKSALKFANSNAERNDDLFKKGVLGHKELEEGKLQKETAEAQIQVAAASMEIAKEHLEACKIIAPFNGRLSKKTIQDFEYVRAGQPLMELIDDEQLLAVMYLPSARKQTIGKNMEMRIKVDETGTTHIGQVYEVSGQIDPRSRTFEVKILIDNRDRKLTAGMAGVLLDK